jgi:hypothetical protein
MVADHSGGRCNVLASAAAGGQLEVIRWAVANGFGGAYDSTDDFPNSESESEEGPRWVKQDLVMEAALGGHLAVIKYALANGYGGLEADFFIGHGAECHPCHRLAFYGHLECLK